MEGGDEVGEERLEQLNKKGFESTEEVVNICELEDALVCYLEMTRMNDE